MNVVLLPNELLGGDHQLIKPQDDAERSRDADREAPKVNLESLGQTNSEGTHRYCSFSSVSMVIVLGRP